MRNVQCIYRWAKIYIHTILSFYVGTYVCLYSTQQFKNTHFRSYIQMRRIYMWSSLASRILTTLPRSESSSLSLSTGSAWLLHSICMYLRISIVYLPSPRSRRSHSTLCVVEKTVLLDKSFSTHGLFEPHTHSRHPSTTAAFCSYT